VAMAGGAGSNIGTGGMATKVQAARRASHSGAHTVIASGHEPDVLLRLAALEPIGSLLLADVPMRSARQQWLADHLQLRGHLSLDAGASDVLLRGGKSLLPVGVVSVGGQFERGDVVACLDPEGREIARGLVNYAAHEARRIQGLPSSQIEAVLGFVEEPELIHRDNLVLTSSGEKR
jgi:glutamate 5-kinase